MVDNVASHQFDFEIEADKDHAQILIQISGHSGTFEDAKKVIEELGIRIIEMNYLSSTMLLLKLDVKDMRSVALRLTERGFLNFKGMNALR